MKTAFKNWPLALKNLEKDTNASAKKIIDDCLDQNSKDVLRKLALNYLGSADDGQASNDVILRRLPMWVKFVYKVLVPHLQANSYRGSSLFVHPQDLRSAIRGDGRGIRRWIL